jgi:hypothetical protein
MNYQTTALYRIFDFEFSPKIGEYSFNDRGKPTLINPGSYFVHPRLGEHSETVDAKFGGSFDVVFLMFRIHNVKRQGLVGRTVGGGQGVTYADNVIYSNCH